MLKPKSQRKNNVEQLDPQERQNPPPPFDTVYHGDCIDIMATMPPASSDFKGPAFTVDEGVNSALPIDEQKIDETVLALLYLTLHDGCRAWKSFDWQAMTRLQEKGLIEDPATKAKSLVLTGKGLVEAERLFKKLFVKE